MNQNITLILTTTRITIKIIDESIVLQKEKQGFVSGRSSTGADSRKYPSFIVSTRLAEVFFRLNKFQRYNTYVI